jgi:hypothetical protein
MVDSGQLNRNFGIPNTKKAGSVAISKRKVVPLLQLKTRRLPLKYPLLDVALKNTAKIRMLNSWEVSDEIGTKEFELDFNSIFEHWFMYLEKKN